MLPVTKTRRLARALVMPRHSDGVGITVGWNMEEGSALAGIAPAGALHASANPSLYTAGARKPEKKNRVHAERVISEGTVPREGISNPEWSDSLREEW